MGDLYLGRVVDAASMKPGSDAAIVDPDRFVQHAVCLGMTGSGKTGLCACLLEELGIAGIPVLVIDPKGDMTNLALAFADHAASDFVPWVDPAEAKREGLTVEALADKTAAMWRKGLADWGVGPDRVERFTKGVGVRIYTPGSGSGIGVDVLSTLSAPSGALRDDPEGLRDLVSGTVGALLSLVGVEADPVADPAHIVLSRIVADAWESGQDADLETVITRLVDPPFKKVGVFPVDTFYPRKDRLALAMQLNGIVASPAFEAWRNGAALDMDALLDTSRGTPINVFYLAHLDDAQRMFFISMLLNRVVAWSRAQSGTSALRALVYFDEVFGFLPPHPRNPPTKHAVLTLMKQARAVGLGTMLVTQNPVDVDYKALSNAGTWFIGRLQTEQDRERVLDGLTAADGSLDRKTVSSWLEKLPSRTFVHRDVKLRAPRLLHSRWAISFLRGPLTRRELESLPKSAISAAPGAPRAAGPVATAPAAAPLSVTAAPAPAASTDGLKDTQPPVPEGTTVRFIDPAVVFSARLQPFFEKGAEPARSDGRTVYKPALYARLTLRFDETRWTSEREEHRLFFPITDDEVIDCGEPALEPRDFLPSAPRGALFGPIPAMIDEKKEIEALQRRVVDDVFRGETDKLFRHKALGLESLAGETREQFAARVAAAAEERADAEKAKLKATIDEKVARLDERRRRYESDRDRAKSDARAQTATEVVNAGELLFGLFFGRRRSVSSVASKRQQTMRANERVGKLEEEIAAIERETYDLESEIEHELRTIDSRWDKVAETFDEQDVRLERDDIRLDEFALLWVPVTRPV